MSVSIRHIRHQFPVIAAIGKTAIQAARQKLGGASGPNLTLPGNEATATVPPRNPELIRAFVAHLGGDPGNYRGVVPPHLFPQWTFPVLTKTLAGIPYPLMELLNGGCHVRFNAPIPAGEPLVTRARLEGIDDDGRRAILHQSLTTGTTSAPDALVIDFYPIVKLRAKDGEAKKESKEKPTVPTDDVREIGRWRLKADAGRDFALLTGDFNPVHWVPPAAKAMGFKNVILHGFAELGRTIEALVKVLWSGDYTKLAAIDVRFVRPLVLPREVGAYIRGNQLWLGDAPGGPAYMVGSFEERR